MIDNLRMEMKEMPGAMSGSEIAKLATAFCENREKLDTIEARAIVKILLLAGTVQLVVEKGGAE